MRDSGMGQKILSKFSFVSFQSVWLRLCFDFDFFTLSEKCLNAEFFLVCTSLYSSWIRTFTRTKYEYLLRKYSYLVRIQENTDQKNSVYGHFSRSIRMGPQLSALFIFHSLKLKTDLSLHKKWSFPLRISSVNVTKCHIY